MLTLENLIVANLIGIGTGFFSYCVVSLLGYAFYETVSWFK